MIKVEVTETAYEGMPEVKITIESPEVCHVNQLQGFFCLIAQTLGYDYIARCSLHTRVTSAIEGDQLSHYEKQQLRALLREEGEPVDGNA